MSNRNRLTHSRWLAAAVSIALCAQAAAQELPVPLRLTDVIHIAMQQRSEVTAAGGRAEAAAQRPAIMGALEDPMISPSIDHHPYTTMQDAQLRGCFDWSIGIEQAFPLSDIRGQRRRGASGGSANRGGRRARPLGCRARSALSLSLRDVVGVPVIRASVNPRTV